MRFDIVTIFPEFFGAPRLPGNLRTPGSGIFGHGILERALRTGLTEAHTHDLRSFTEDRHRTVDDRPFGGGEGMVLKPQPIFACVESLGILPKARRDARRESVILLSAQGRTFTQRDARELAGLERIVFLCGRYEGVDERVNELLCDRELSIGDYVLSGGELGAAVILDAVVRLLPGVLGHADSARYESFGEGDADPQARTEDGVPAVTNSAGGLLDYPHYTRPAEFRGAVVPEVLAEGDHVKVRAWRRKAQLAKTLANRPDLLERAELSAEDRRYVSELQRARASASE